MDKASPQECDALKEQGNDFLKKVDARRKDIKSAYRQAVLNFETTDVDPIVWSTVLQDQKEIKSELLSVRGLRTQLLNTLQISGAQLEASGIRTTLSEETQAQELYSSDEETQQLSDAKQKIHVAFRNSMGEAFQNKAKALWAIASGPDPVGAVVEHYVTFLCSIPQLPELLAAYVEEFLEEATEERRAEMLGALLSEAITAVVPLPKVKAAQLVGIKKKLGKAGKQVAATRAQVGTKMEYVFGKATGTSHNIARSKSMLKQLQRTGIFDNKAGRNLFKSHLEKAYRSAEAIRQSNGRYLRESLLMGPNGALKVQSVWEGKKLITVTLFDAK